jgi:hypothetical protein
MITISILVGIAIRGQQYYQGSKATRCSSKIISRHGEKCGGIVVKYCNLQHNTPTRLPYWGKYLIEASNCT